MPEIGREYVVPDTTAVEPGAIVDPATMTSVTLVVRNIMLGPFVTDGFADPTVGVASTPFGSVTGVPTAVGSVNGVPSMKTAPPDVGNEYDVPDMTAVDPGNKVVPGRMRLVIPLI